MRSIMALVRNTFSSGLTTFLAGSAPLGLANGGTGGTDQATARTALDVYSKAEVAGVAAPIASPAFTGNPTAPTQTAGDNSTKIATTAYADNAGVGSAAQSWQVVTGSRSSGTTYTNSTVRPIQVLVSCNDAGGGTATVSVTVADTAIISGLTYDGGDSVGCALPSFIVPAGATYSVSVSGASIGRWAELR